MRSVTIEIFKHFERLFDLYVYVKVEKPLFSTAILQRQAVVRISCVLNEQQFKINHNCLKKKQTFFIERAKNVRNVNPNLHVTFMDLHL